MCCELWPCKNHGMQLEVLVRFEVCQLKIQVLTSLLQNLAQGEKQQWSSYLAAQSMCNKCLRGVIKVCSFRRRPCSSRLGQSILLIQDLFSCRGLTSIAAEEEQRMTFHDQPNTKSWKRHFATCWATDLASFLIRSSYCLWTWILRHWACRFEGGPSFSDCDVAALEPSLETGPLAKLMTKHNCFWTRMLEH